MTGWKEEFDRLLPLLGHRNWILVVDKAYPWQSASGITTFCTGASTPEVLAWVINRLGESDHLRPVAYVDWELSALDEGLCPGIETIRSTYGAVLEGVDYRSIPHEEIFARLDEASRLFSVVVLKTDCILPYTSVFLELDCGYWDVDREKKLREKLSHE